MSILTICVLMNVGEGIILAAAITKKKKNGWWFLGNAQ